MLVGNKTFVGLEADAWSAIATAAAVVVALLLAWSERKRSDRLISEERARTDSALAAERALTREALDLERERWDRQLLDAERAQVELVGVLPIQSEDGVVLRIVNHSSAPIADVQLFALDGRLVRGKPWEMSVGPGATTQVQPPPMFGPVVEGGNRIGFTFRDNAGRYWARYLNGSLVSLRGVDPEAILSEPSSWPNH